MDSYYTSGINVSLALYYLVLLTEVDNIFLKCNCPVPKSKKNIRSLLGLINYYCKFFPRMAQLNSTFTALIKKSAPQKIRWTPFLDQ